MPSVAKYELNADMMRYVTPKTVQETIGIEVEGYRCDGEMLVDVLIKAASENSNVAASCQERLEVADSNTICERLNEPFDVAKLWEQEARLNQTLARHIPDKMPQGGLEIAIDFHDEPFYTQATGRQTQAKMASLCRATFARLDTDASETSVSSAFWH